MKVILIGKGYGCANAPKEGETWGICQSTKRPFVKRIIDMNDYSLWGDFEAKMDRLSRKMASENNIPYYDLTNYPIKEIIEFFGVDYFSNTVDYALALAIYDGATEIDLYGVNMELGSEYEFEKPGVEFWIGLAMGRGIKVAVFGDRSTILKTKDKKLYGYGTWQKQPKENGT
jgi:hypothetical protein